MANDKTRQKTGSRTEHKAYWQQPWAQRVLQGPYSPFEKLLFMRIGSFGAKGCIMYSRTLATELGCCERYVREGISKLWKGKEFWITGWDSRNRCIYANHNPEVKAMAEERYKAELKAGRVTDKSDFYLKNKTRGYKSPSEMTGLDKKKPVENHVFAASTRNYSAGLDTNNPEP